jgi:Zn-dependent protease
MFRLRSLQLGRVFGIPVELNPTWLIALLAGSSALGLYFDELAPGGSVLLQVLFAVGTTCALYACLVAHELSHSLVARRSGIHVHRITLFVFGGVAQLGEEPRTPASEIALGLAGPAMSVLLSGTFVALALLANLARAPLALLLSLETLAEGNAVIALFNLLPGYPMDGGRAVHAYLWWASGDRLGATRAASWVARAFAALVGATGLWLGATGAADGDWSLVLSGSWLVVLGAFVFVLSRTNYRRQVEALRLAAIPAGAVALRPLPVVDAAMPADDAAELAFRRGVITMGVVSGGRFVGVLPHHGQLDAPRPAGLAGDAAVQDRALFVDASESLETALRRLEGGATALVTVEDGRATGLVTAESVERAMR